MKASESVGAIENSCSCAAAAAATLREAGVKHVYGHPGGEVLEFMDALESAGVRFVLTGHESAAAFMAGVTGRLTGIPGVCLSTLGPGACNLVLGVGSAFLDRDALLAFSARTSAKRSATHTKQNLPLNDLFAPISKWSVSLDGVRTAEMVSQAITVARRPPRGPVFLSMSAETARATDLADGLCVTPPETADFSGNPSQIISALKAARCPAALVGIALDPARDLAVLWNFLAVTRIPYAVLPQAKGFVDEGSGRFLGTVEAGGDQYILEKLEQSDCVLGIGFDPVEAAHDWHLNWPLYSVANSSLSFGRYRPLAECSGDVSQILSEILAHYTGSPGWTDAEICDVRSRTERTLCPSAEHSAAGLSPYHVVQTIRQALPESTIVAGDVGAHKMVLCQIWSGAQPGSFLVSNGLSAMGFGVPAALTASFLSPDRPVVGIIGDGGFGMMVQELETARRLGVAPLLVVFCDRSLAIIKIAQSARRSPHVGVDFGPVDWATVATGFGAQAATPVTIAALRDAVEQWRRHPELTVLAVPLDPELYQGLSY